MLRSPRNVGSSTMFENVEMFEMLENLENVEICLIF